MKLVIRRGLQYWAGLPSLPWTWAPSLARRFGSMEEARIEKLPPHVAGELTIGAAPAGKW